MKTVIDYKDGNSETVEDSFPSFDVDNLCMCCIDEESTVLTEEIPLAQITRVILEND